ncbi:MAG: membrane protein insertase YidC [Pseudomonadota bacterium]
MDDSKNILIAIVLSVAVLVIYQVLVVEPEAKRRKAIEEVQIAAQNGGAGAGAGSLGVDGALPEPGAAVQGGLPGQQGGLTAPAAPDVAPDRASALARGPGRVAIDTPTLTGSINLEGARFDDLELKAYHETPDPESDRIILLNPVGSDGAYLAFHGWRAAGDAAASAPGPATIWSAPAGAALSPDTPVTLTYIAGELTFERTISVDENYMFRIEDTVRNAGAAPAQLFPYGVIQRFGVPSDLANFMILHEGALGVFSDTLRERKYKKLTNDGPFVETATGGWLGVTDKYWLAALAPAQDAPFTGEFKDIGQPGAPIYQTSYIVKQPTVAPAGGSATSEALFFAGAKKVKLLRTYENELGVAAFDRAVDWGRLFFLTKPIFTVLNFFGQLTGNYGVAILLLTLCVKLVFFPLANQSYVAMSKMKKLQPEMTRMREQYKDDRMKMQQEMVALYKKEKLNPLAGCLPVLIQIPVFFALYKVLFVTIELRHAPFFGWIQDLSAVDPTSVFNLFGLLPFEPTAVPVVGAFLGIGVWPLMMGVAMWFQTKLNPPPADPVQQQVFALMPIFFTILLAGFASGLVIYWWWNTSLSILQQWLIMKRMGVSVDWGARFKTPGFIAKYLDKSGPGASKS